MEVTGHNFRCSIQILWIIACNFHSKLLASTMHTCNVIIPEHTNKQDLTFKSQPEVVSDDFLGDVCIYCWQIMLIKWYGQVAGFHFMSLTGWTFRHNFNTVEPYLIRGQVYNLAKGTNSFNSWSILSFGPGLIPQYGTLPLITGLGPRLS